jgi:hypothetical protein
MEAGGHAVWHGHRRQWLRVHGGSVENRQLRLACLLVGQVRHQVARILGCQCNCPASAEVDLTASDESTSSLNEDGAEDHNGEANWSTLLLAILGVLDNEERLAALHLGRVLNLPHQRLRLIRTRLEYVDMLQTNTIMKNAMIPQQDINLSQSLVCIDNMNV